MFTTSIHLREISIHALREEGDLRSSSSSLMLSQFLSTPSARRATIKTELEENAALKISIHALREEGDRPPAPAWHRQSNFYPRPPRGGRPSDVRERAVEQSISIHALREEGDQDNIVNMYGSLDFYPRPPRGGRRMARASTSLPRNFYPRPPRGGRQDARIQSLQPFVFLSTPSARRATPARRGTWATGGHFYPRPPRGGRPMLIVLFYRPFQISIHALREEGDMSGSRCRP